MAASPGENAVYRAVSEAKLRGCPLLDLSITNPTQCTADYPHASIKATFATLDNFVYSPEPFGHEEARRSICEYYRLQGISIRPGQVILTASTSEAYGFLFKMLCDPGNEVLIPIPSYPLFAYLAALECVRIIPYDLHYDGAWFVDFQSIKARISPRTRAIVIVNPNNPTGSFLSTWEMEELVALAAKCNLPVISDEVFTDYRLRSTQTQRPTPSLIGQESVLSFSFNGLSKAAGMPQMKLAWIAVSGPETEVKRALDRMEIVADTYLSVGTPVQNALPRLLAIGEGIRKTILERIEANLETLDRRMKNTALHRLNLDGGWSAIVQLPATKSEEDWVTGLIQHKGVITQPGYFFDMPREAYLVLSLITPQATFEDGIERICGYVESRS